MNKARAAASLALAISAATPAFAQPTMPLPSPGEEIVYQTAQSGPNYHTFITQVSGNGKQNWGDEIKLGAATTNRSLSHIAISTQTFSGPYPEYTPAFVEMRVWLNDGPNADGEFIVPQPGTLLATSRVAGPSYPAGGNHTAGGIIIDFPLANVVVPEIFTVTIVNLNADGIQDGSNPAGNQWGPFLNTGATNNGAPPVGTDIDAPNTAFNTNNVGTSRTGPRISFTNNGFWVWTQANGSAPGDGWGNGRVTNASVDQTLYALAAPTAATVYWDVDGANTAGAGGATPTGDWSGFVPNFNSNPAGTGAGMTKSRTTTGDTVVFGDGGAASGAYTVTVSGTQSASGINIEEGAVTFTGGTLATGVFNVSSGASGTVASAINGGATNSLTKNGDGTLAVDGAVNTYTGATTVNAGTLVLNNGVKTGNALTIASGATAVVPEATPNTYDGAMVVPAGQNSTGSKVNALTITGTGVLDLGNSDMAIDYVDPNTPLDDVVALLVAGYNGGGWDGTGGIISNTLSVNNPNQLDPSIFGLGYAENGALPTPYGNLEAQGGPLFSDQDVDLSTVLIKFTWVGDLNLDGFVDFGDLSVFNTNYDNGQSSGRYWFEGDFNYDGFIDFSDLSLFNTNYDPNKPSLPEPATGLALAGLLGAAMLRRTRAGGAALASRG